MRRHMRTVLFRVVMLSTITIAGIAPSAADPSDLPNMAREVTGTFSGLGRVIAVPAYARGAAAEVVGVEKFKRENGAQPETRTRRVLPGHRAH
jgi:hypothetical protein